MRRDGGFQKRLLCGTAAAALLLLATNASAEETKFNIAAQPLVDGLNEFAKQSGRPVMFTPDIADAKVTHGVADVADPEKALNLVLADTGLTWRRSGDTYLIMRASDPQSGSAAGDGADGTVEALIVTAQKREEDIQDVPIAISAFTQEDLTRSQVAGGPDLMTQVPNFTFTKTNFSSYSIQIRGIGTQAISATTDAAVAVAFNNTPFIRNRFFEQEFYDLQRIEVLRGPQGTLYGRNATAGVVDIISAKPKFAYEARLSADAANYNSTRFEGMVNIPLVEDTVALRLAGAWTKRNGYATNEITGNPIDGRDLWSTRVSLRFAPSDRIDANLIWEHFEENDDRLRSGKQLCKSDVITDNTIGGVRIGQSLAEDSGQGGGADVDSILPFAGPTARFSRGCAPASLYSPESFQTPTGQSLPYYVPLGAIFLPSALNDPYVSRTQSHDLRMIESTVDPEYRAKNDLGEFQISSDLTEHLTLSSETAYARDFIFSQQDFNRFNTQPGAWQQPDPNGLRYREGVLQEGPNGGIFCDPQIGCADRLVALDLSTAKSTQFSEELRLSSNFDGPFNFSLGANFLRYDTEDKYYVFINSLTLISAISPYGNNIFSVPYVGGQTSNIECIRNGPVPSDPSQVYGVANCTYIDPNPIHSLNDQGHNYFLSRNPYKLISYAAFGEVYYNIADNLKLTAGLRWTVDKKQAPRIPSWTLAANSAGYALAETVKQEWREPTGRIALDWKPDLSFTDETLLYASYAHGYKAGGANPPPMVYVFYAGGVAAASASQQSATRPKTFDPEFINAFEVGAKNTLLDGKATLNANAFYYDYTGYQISEIVDRSAFNHNYDATVWGLEIEADWRPLENLRLGFKGGYEKTRIADGEKAVDLMDRTAGNPDWVLVRPFPTFASNCILPVSVFMAQDSNGDPTILSPGGISGGNVGPCERAYQLGQDPVTSQPYDPDFTPPPNRPDYPGFNPFDESQGHNFGEGFYKDLSGHELPNAPHFTATVTTDYTVPLPNDWLMTLHGDFYYQSEAWWRIFNTPGYDKLKAYTNVNLAAIFSNEDAGWKVMAYIKNVMDRDSITGAFLNSDDTDLTTNVFMTEPRLYGLRITKEWTGGSLLGSFGSRHEGPYPFTVEVGGQAQRHDAPNATYRPAFMDEFAPAIDPTNKQHEDLDWGDGREVKLTYRTAAGWRLSLDGRYGETNRRDRPMLKGEDMIACTVFAGTCYTEPAQKSIFNNYGAALISAREEHTVVDFAIGRDVGFGALARSSVSGSLRYARIKSEFDGVLYGAPDWNVPHELFIKYDATHHEYRAAMDADRQFQGAGPVLSWEAASHLVGNETTGHLDVDWSVSGGVLFGKQKTAISGVERAIYYSGKYTENPAEILQDDVAPLHIGPRSKNVTVPVFGASLGLAYAVDRFSIGAGYRWERYFNAIDGGIAERKAYDRTFDGPYFKIAVGFGG
jgi:outer membrane receptor protein involved in Fe transport